MPWLLREQGTQYPDHPQDRVTIEKVLDMLGMKPHDLRRNREKGHQEP
jgi:hypothetical protein